MKINVNDNNASIAFQLIGAILLEISQGNLNPGDQVYKILSLAEMSGASHNTAAKALKWLKQNGYITTLRGKITVVTNSDKVRNLQEYSANIADIKDVIEANQNIPDIKAIILYLAEKNGQ